MSQNDLLKQLVIDKDARQDSGSGRSWVYVGGAAAVVLVAALAWWALAGGSKATVVSTATAIDASKLSTQASVLDATGYITARRLATVSAKVTGKVREVLIEEGMRVEEGQVLATLDDTDANAQLALSQAQLDQARSAQAEIDAQLRQAEADLKRQQDLSQRGLTAASALDGARASAETLRARRVSAERSVRVAQEGLAIARVQVDNTIIRAPFAGVVVAKAAQPGEMISPLSAGGGFTRTGVGTIVDMDSLEVQVDVNEAFIGRVQPQQPVEATLNAYPDWRIPGSVIAIIPTADRSRATVKVRIALDAKDPRIVPDMGVRVAFLERKDAAAPPPVQLKGVLVPESAVRREGERAHVFVYDQASARRVDVELGTTQGALRQITRGLAPGDQVILDPPADLTAGAAVTTDAAP